MGIALVIVENLIFQCVFYLSLPPAVSFLHAQKRNKKGHPSGAGEADFLQIALWDAPDGMAYKSSGWYEVDCKSDLRRKSEVVPYDGVYALYGVM
jgi:hypothetical protein